MSKLRRLGEAIDRMQWPERIIWIIVACSGSTVMAVGPYELTVTLQAKVMFAAIFLLFVMAAAYFRLKYLQTTGQYLSVESQSGGHTDPTSGVTALLDVMPGHAQAMLSTLHGKPGVKREWPKSTSGFGGHTITIRSHGTEPLFNIKIPIQVAFKEAVLTERRGCQSGELTKVIDGSVDISRLEPGQPFVFYYHNPTHQFCWAFFGHTATCEIGESQKKQKVAVKLPSHFGYGLSCTPLDAIYETGKGQQAV